MKTQKQNFTQERRKNKENVNDLNRKETNIERIDESNNWFQ